MQATPTSVPLQRGISTEAIVEMAELEEMDDIAHDRRSFPTIMTMESQPDMQTIPTPHSQGAPESMQEITTLPSQVYVSPSTPVEISTTPQMANIPPIFVIRLPQNAVTAPTRPSPIVNRIGYGRPPDRDPKSVSAYCSVFFTVVLVVIIVLAKSSNNSNSNSDYYSPSSDTYHPFVDNNDDSISDSFPDPDTTSRNKWSFPLKMENNFSTKLEEIIACNTTECLTMAKQIKSSMHESFNPCEDFYRYACQGWIDSNIPPKGENSTQPFDQRYMKNIDLIQSLIENLAHTQTTSSFVELKAYNFYTSCINRRVRSDFFDGVSSEVNKHHNISGGNNHPPQQTLRYHKTSRHRYNLNLYDTMDPMDDPALIKQGCALVTEDFFPELISRLFVQHYLPNEELDAFSSFIFTLRSTYLSSITTNAFPWMDSTSKNRIHDHIDKLPILLGYTQHIMDTDWVSRIYENVYISASGEQFVKNFGTLEATRKLVEGASFHDNSTTAVSAYYAPVANEVFVPAGMIQLPLFHRSFPNVLKYAIAGTSLGHELTHALVTYVEGPKSLNVDTFILDLMNIKHASSVSSQQTQDKYKSLSDCVEEKYSNYSINLPSNVTLKINGTATLGENVADLIGIQIAFKSFIENSPVFQSYFLPGMEKFTKEQIFFIANAQKNCQSFTNPKLEEEMLKEEIETDTHSPDSIRVLGMLSNFDEFSKAFKCPVGSRYNPGKKCTFLNGIYTR